MFKGEMMLFRSVMIWFVIYAISFEKMKLCFVIEVMVFKNGVVLLIYKAAMFDSRMIMFKKALTLFAIDTLKLEGDMVLLKRGMNGFEEI